MDVLDARETYNAQLGSEDGKEKHFLVDYDDISWFYAQSRGIKPEQKLYLEIRKVIKGTDPLLLYQDNVKADESSVIRQKIVWNNINNKINFLTVYAMVRENDKNGKVLYDADGSFSMATSNLMKNSILMKMPNNKSAVVVEGSNIPASNNGTCICKEQYKDLIWGEKVSCTFRKKVVQIAKKLKLPQQNYEGANWLMAVMALETAYTFSPKIGTFKDDPNDNRKGGYVGLIQFGKGAAIDLKIKRSELLKMSAEDWVEKYFNLPQFKDKNLFINKTALYLAVNYPDSFKHASNKDYVVYDSSSL